MHSPGIAAFQFASPIKTALGAFAGPLLHVQITCTSCVDTLAVWFAVIAIGSERPVAMQPVPAEVFVPAALSANASKSQK